MAFFFLLFAQGAFALDQKCKVGLITGSHGEALRESPLQAKVEHLKSGLCISDGQALITRKNSDLGISLSSGSAVAIAPESELLVGFPIGGKPTKLNITRGEIKVRYGSKDGPVVNLLRLTVTSKNPATTLLGEVFHDGQEAWLVVTRGSVIARLGNESPGAVVSAGQSLYITESQKEMPRVVGLDEREMEALTQDPGLKQTISQLLMVESGAEKKPESAVDSEQDLTLEQYAAEERANLLGKGKPSLPPPPVVTDIPLVAMPHEAPTARPAVIPQRSESPPEVSAVPIPIQTAERPLAKGVIEEKTPEKVSDKFASLRVEVGPSFYSDSSGYEVGAKYLTSLRDSWSIGAGLGYSHASKNQLSVSNWKLTALMNYRYNLSEAVSILPEFSLGAGIENVSFPLKTVNSGAALYYSPDLLFELNVDRAPHFHPGIAFLEQGYLGSTSLTSMAIEFMTRFDF